MKRILISLLISLQIIQPLCAASLEDACRTIIANPILLEPAHMPDLIDKIALLCPQLPPDQARELAGALALFRKQNSNPDEFYEYIAAACQALLNSNAVPASDNPMANLLTHIRDNAMKQGGLAQGQIDAMVPMMKELIDQEKFSTEVAALAHDLKQASLGSPKTGILCVIAGAVLYVSALVVRAIIKNKTHTTLAARFVDPATLMLLGSGVLKPIAIAIVGGLAVWWIYAKVSHNPSKELIERVNKLEADINRRQTATNNQFGWHSKEIKELRDRTNRLQDSIDDIVVKVDNLDASLNTTNTFIEEFRKGILQTLATLGEEQNTTIKQLEALKEKNKELQKKLPDALIKMNTIATQINNLQKLWPNDVTKLQTNMDSFKKELDALYTIVQALHNDLKKTKKQKHAAQAEASSSGT